MRASASDHLLDPNKSLLRELRPLLAFQISFQTKNGRRATDTEHPVELHALLQLYRDNKAELKLMKGLGTFRPPCVPHATAETSVMHALQPTSRTSAVIEALPCPCHSGKPEPPRSSPCKARKSGDGAGGTPVRTGGAAGFTSAQKRELRAQRLR